MKLYRIILLMTAVLLFPATLAALSLPYDYYTFLRIVVCGVAVYSTFRAKDTLIPFLGLLMIAILFNPLLPVHFERSVWRFIDLATAATFIRLAFRPLKTQNQS